MIKFIITTVLAFIGIVLLLALSIQCVTWLAWWINR